MDIGQLINAMLPFAERLPVIRAVLGFALVFFIPGFAWTFIFFRRVNFVERIALSFGLSIATVTLGIITLHVLFGMTINGANALLVIIVITIIALIVYILKKFATHQSEASGED